MISAIPPLNTQAEAAELLRISESKIKALALAGRIGRVYIDSKPMVTGAEIEAYIASLPTIRPDAAS